MSNTSKRPANGGPVVSMISYGQTKNKDDKLRIDDSNERFLLRKLMGLSVSNDDFIRIKLEGEFKKFIEEQPLVSKRGRGRPRKEISEGQEIEYE